MTHEHWLKVTALAARTEAAEATVAELRELCGEAADAYLRCGYDGYYKEIIDPLITRLLAAAGDP